MKKKPISVLILLITIVGCKKIDCSKLIFDDVNKLTYKNNQLFSGKCYSYFSDSKLESVREYKDGKDHGEWIFYYDNGNIATEGSMKENKKIKNWKYYFYSGELQYLHNYDEDGNRIGLWIEFSKLGDTLSIKKY